MEAGEIDFDNDADKIEKDILDMKENTRAFLAKAKRESDRATKDRPSVDELREQGKILTFTEVAKVCQRQVSEVETIGINLYVCTFCCEHILLM